MDVNHLGERAKVLYLDIRVGEEDLSPLEAVSHLHLFFFSPTLIDLLEMLGWRSLTCVIPYYICGVGPVQVVKAVASILSHSMLEDYLLVAVDHYHSVVELICYHCVPILETNRIWWQRIWIAILRAVGEELENNMLLLSHLNYPCMT